MKGKDMVWTDVLSRQKNDDSNPHEIIPISSNTYKILNDNYYSIDKYLTQAGSQTRSSSIKLPEVHGMGKNLDPNIKPEKQHANSKQGSVERPSIGQGRAGLRRKKPDLINQTINQPSDLSQKIPGRMKIETGKTNQAHSRDPAHSINNTNRKITDNLPLILDLPFHPSTVYRPPTKPIRHKVSNQQGSQSLPGIEDINPKINLDFKENSPFQEGVMSETFQRPDKSFFQEPKELGDLINKGNLIQKFL